MFVTSSSATLSAAVSRDLLMARHRLPHHHDSSPALHVVDYSAAAAACTPPPFYAQYSAAVGHSGIV